MKIKYSITVTGSPVRPKNMRQEDSMPLVERLGESEVRECLLNEHLFVESALRALDLVPCRKATS